MFLRRACGRVRVCVPAAAVAVSFERVVRGVALALRLLLLLLVKGMDRRMAVCMPGRCTSSPESLCRVSGRCCRSWRASRTWQMRHKGERAMAVVAVAVSVTLLGA